MTLENLIPVLQSEPDHRALSAAVKRLRPGQVLEISGLPIAARQATLAATIAAAECPVLVVVGRQNAADEVTAALSDYLSGEHTPLLWPAPDPLPYEQIAVDRVTSARRVETLSRLAEGQPITVVAAARALSQCLTPPGTLRRQAWHLRVGQRLRSDALIASLLEAGYDLVPVVQAPGEVGRRGGIIDVFPPGAEQALRIELFGDEVDSLRIFDPDTQRTVSRIDRTTLLPPLELSLGGHEQALERLRLLDTAALRPEVAEEWERNLQRLERGQVTVGLELMAPYLVPTSASLLDYLPPEHLVVLVEPASIHLSLTQVEAQAEELRGALQDAGELPHGLVKPYFTWEQISRRLGAVREVAFGPVPTTWVAGTRVEPAPAPAYAPDVPTFAARRDALADELRVLLADDWAVILATEQTGRLTELLEEHEIFPRIRKRPGGSGPLETPLPPTPGTVEVVHARLQGGWSFPGLRLLVLTDRELFGYRREATRPPRRRARQPAVMLPGLTPGSYVVHIEHGIARYGGLVKLDLSGVQREYLLLDYAQGDRLYLPVDQIDRITLYEAGGIDPKLNRLGSPEWNRVKQRVRQAVREMAFELLQLYAARETAEGHAFAPDGVWDHELEESFPHVETVDQLRAITEVKRDMEQPQPMDRLVCGDVGYGKTEVALRAAFKAVNDGYQVALLVPTTILALQHYHTFRGRLAPFPVKVEMLSRLRTRQDQAEVLRGLAAGEVDIIIGTHRLLQRDVNIKHLGLLIIDEEQRFGVAHKEQLKRARATIDALTMTATPIPRTLYMALSGIRDLSVINTPPRDRMPIRTFVTPSNDGLIREAILRELNRGGQVYFVHNRVQSIHYVLERLRKLVPEARFGVGHGQMDENELERVMLAFMQQEYDVLLCTTIIESGVDIPNVNTVIIDQAHTLGLTQLYQLRGRVGRSNHRAYAYLLYNDKAALTAEAVARLEAIQEATELGAGFQIALRDLEIRGAGNVLGAEQSGHIAAVGFDLYTRMLATAVEEIKAGRPIEEPEAVSVDLPIDAMIPEGYAGDEQVRIGFYRKIAAVRSYGQLRDLQEEMIDRFGPLPDSVLRLVELARLRIRASGLGITTIVERDGTVYIRPLLGSRLNQGVLRHALGEGVHVTPNQVRLSTNYLSTDVWTAVTRVVSEIENADATVLAAAAAG